MICEVLQLTGKRRADVAVEVPYVTIGPSAAAALQAENGMLTTPHQADLGHTSQYGHPPGIGGETLGYATLLVPFRPTHVLGDHGQPIWTSQRLNLLPAGVLGGSLSTQVVEAIEFAVRPTLRGEATAVQEAENRVEQVADDTRTPGGFIHDIEGAHHEPAGTRRYPRTRLRSRPMDRERVGRTIDSMRKRWSEAPQPVRRLALYCYLALLPVVAAQVVAATALVRRIQAMAESASSDPFAMLAGTEAKVEVTVTTIEKFSSGFAMSGAASFGVLALFAGTWLIPPYRHRSLKVLEFAVVAQALLLVWSAVGLFNGDRVLDASLIGTFATALYGIPVLLLARNATVRAWSIRFEPPRPPLPSDTPGEPLP